MNIRDFVTPSDFESIRENVFGRHVFSYRRKCKVKNKTVEVVLNGRFIEKDLADSHWDGNDYLVGFGESRSGGGEYGGRSFAIAEFPMFERWETFKSWFDGLMKRNVEYESEEYGQVSLF